MNVWFRGQTVEFGNQTLKNGQDVWKLVLVCASVPLHVLCGVWYLNL